MQKGCVLPNPCGVLSRPTVSSSVDSSWRLDLSPSPSFYRCFLHRLNSPPSSVAADAAVGGGGGGYGGHSPFCPFSPAIKELCVPAPAESAPNALFLGCVKVLRLAARHFYSARSPCRSPPSLVGLRDDALSGLGVIYHGIISGSGQRQGTNTQPGRRRVHGRVTSSQSPRWTDADGEGRWMAGS